MKVKVYNESGQATGEEVELNPRIFEQQKPRSELVHAVAVAMLGNARKAAASAKTRGEVRGGGRKPWKQKGTGRARAGSIRSPLWRGGGVTFGPRAARNFAKKINRKARRLGFFSVLTDRVRTRKLIILDKLELPKGKTKELIAKLKDLETLTKSRKYLIVIPQKDEKLTRAARNLSHVSVRSADNINVLDLLKAESVVVLKTALPIVEKTYGLT